MAVPAFQKTRSNSQAAAIQNNLTALYRASQVYCDSHQVSEVAYTDLVGPGKPVPVIVPVAGEDYSKLKYGRGLQLVIQTPDGRRFVFPRRMPKTTPPPSSDSFLPDPGPAFGAPSVVPTPAAPVSAADQAITNNLRMLYEAADHYYAEHSTTSATYEDLVGPGKLVPAVTPVQGEDYRSLLFKQGHPLRLYLKFGRTVVYPQP
jgi:hypothetical protein